MDDKKKRRSNNAQPPQGNEGEYDGIYGELPKEVQSYLMETHPLISKNTEKPSRSRSRSKSQQQEYESHVPTASTREDVDEVREARMQQVGSELNQIRNTPQQEGDPTKYVSRRGKSAQQENARYDGNEDFEDGIRYVSVMPSRKKASTQGPVSQSTHPTAPPSGTSPSRRRRKKDNSGTDHGRKSKKDSQRDLQNYEPQEFDFDAREKQENLDYLYNDAYAYEDESFLSGKGKIFAVLFLITIILMVFLLFKTASLSNALELAEAEVENQKTIETKYETLQLEKLQLEEEINVLLNPVVLEDEFLTEDGETPAENAGETGDLSSTTVYTVMAGDSAWSIAQKVYNNGADFKRILDANNMSESDTVTPGMKLTIPR
ncbi:MAG: LysM peptidoglycan-binding domain-containing protein [Bacillota bacterium]